MATEWGVPPWQVEAELTQEWYEYWCGLRAERHALEKQHADEQKRRGGGR